MLFNPAFLAGLAPGEAVFVMAHELLHLALNTHERGRGSDPFLVNFAHDYLINDLLAEQLSCPVPAGGLRAPGARHLSLERLPGYLRRHRDQVPARCWQRGQGPAEAVSVMGRALREAGLLPDPDTRPPGDVLGVELELAWFPEEDPKARGRQAEEIREVARQALALEVLLQRGPEVPGRHVSPGTRARTITALIGRGRRSRGRGRGRNRRSRWAWRSCGRNRRPPRGGTCSTAIFRRRCCSSRPTRRWRPWWC
jgi:hypothetical protein